MKINEILTSDETLDLWRVIDKNVWQVLDKQAAVLAARKSRQVPPITATAPTKAQFKRRGTQIAAATARDEIDPNAHASDKLQQAQQQQIQHQLVTARLS